MFNLIKKTFKKCSHSQLILLFSIISIFLSWRLLYIHHGWVNDDFVLYHEAARLFSIGEYKEGFKLYGWPLYPLLLSTFHKLTGSNLIFSAQIITTIFFTISTFSFLKLIDIVSDNKLAITSGALTLFSSSYIVGDVLPMLIRDPGFWAFYISSIILFIKFYRNPTVINGIYWQLAAILATLFRIEGITFLLLLPIISLFDKSLRKRESIFFILKANSITITISLIAATILLTNPTLTIQDLGRLQEIFTFADKRLSHTFFELSNKSSLFAKIILKGHFDQYAAFGLTLSLLGILILKCVFSIGLINLGLSGYFFCRKPPSVNDDSIRILLLVAYLACINIITIFLSTFLLSARYIVPLVLVFLVFSAASFALIINESAKFKYKGIYKKSIVTLIILIMGYSLFNIIKTRDSRFNFEQDAVAYLKVNNTPNEKIFFTTPRSRLYAGAVYSGREHASWEHAIESGSIYKYDYLMIYMQVNEDTKKKELYLFNNLNDYELIKEFFGSRDKKKVMLFKKINNKH
jgi:hypothetical protein